MEACTDGHMVTMVFDDESHANVNMQDEILPLIKAYKPPFHFEPPVADNDDEESGNAWVF